MTRKGFLYCYLVTLLDVLSLIAFLLAFSRFDAWLVAHQAKELVQAVLGLLIVIAIVAACIWAVVNHEPSAYDDWGY